MKRLAGIVIFFALTASVTAIIVFYGMGYRPNLKEKTIVATGIISIKSQPQGSVVTINGEEKGVTNLDISDLLPGKYKIKISKEGFGSWEKEIIVKKELVNILDVVLFPTTPNLKALTSSGVISPLVSPNGEKIVFGTNAPGNQGIWSLSLSSKNFPLPIFRSLFPIAKNTDQLNFTQGAWEFSPDSAKLLLTLNETGYLLETDRLNENPTILGPDQLQKIKTEWQKANQKTLEEQIKKLGPKAIAISSELKNIEISPDKKKFFGTKDDGTTVVFNSSPPPGNGSDNELYILPKANKYLWFSTSNHLIMIEDSSISIIELDASNKATIYTGTFENNFVASWKDASRLVIYTNLNKVVNPLANLYSIDLR